MSITPQEAQKVLSEADCLYTAEDVEQTFDRMAAEIEAKYAESDPLILSVMCGGIVSAGCLLRRLSFPLQIDYLHATRYEGGTRGGELCWLAKPTQPLKDRVVLIIDDILDEGITLQKIKAFCEQEGAKAVYIAVLVVKQHERRVDIQANIVGLNVEDRYVFGSGMDYKGYLRNIPGIYAVKGL